MHFVKCRTKPLPAWVSPSGFGVGLPLEIKSVFSPNDRLEKGKRRRSETGSLGAVKAVAIVVHYELCTANDSKFADDITATASAGI